MEVGDLIAIDVSGDDGSVIFGALNVLESKN